MGLLQLEKGPADMKVSGRLKDYDVAVVYIGHKGEPNYTVFAVSMQKAFKIDFSFRLINIILQKYIGISVQYRIDLDGFRP